MEPSDGTVRTPEAAPAPGSLRAAPVHAGTGESETAFPAVPAKEERGESGGSLQSAACLCGPAEHPEKTPREEKEEKKGSKEPYASPADGSAVPEAKTEGTVAEKTDSGVPGEETTAKQESGDSLDEERGPSRLKFPSYDDFLREEEEDRNAEEPDEEEPGKANLDAAFELFMSEVKDMPAVTGKSNGRGKKEARTAMRKFKSSDEECLRLTCQTFPSPFQVLLLGPEASEDDIRKQYRKLSLLIHPDKCKHPNAQEAFQVVNKAYEQLQRPEMREKYRDVIEEAKRRVLKENAKENKKRRTQSIDVPLLSEDPEELQTEIMEMCEKLLEETRERREYAERTRQANERYEKEQLEKQANEELEKCRERKEWLDKRDERVGAWREYQSAIQAKDVTLQAFTGVKHRREERKEDDLVRKKKQMQGIDTSYKDSWR
ncbi:DnaJ domain-containing protein [Toxoplasma gondii VAND]|uniref:DnaJ domain-containing protein n=2 Tax=Toxoplasma gondii TaxID=5811 RepID=A0A086Q6N1_TOXGO|nr:DnaJ domain-containing protein [Toxoplasma gondii VAND]